MGHREVAMSVNDSVLRSGGGALEGTLAVNEGVCPHPNIR